MNNTVINNDKTIDLVFRKPTDGYWITLIDHDRLYEIIDSMMDLEIMVHEDNNYKFKIHKNHLVCKYVRYLFDDGG